MTKKFFWLILCYKKSLYSIEMKQPYLFQLACLVAVQFVVNAKILIVDPFDRAIDSFGNTEATYIDRVLQGYIESPDPSDACTNITPPSYPSNYTMLKFALINGTSECDLITKMQNVAAVGYDVAVVYNPSEEPFDYNITFPIKSQVNLSVVIVLYEDGILIKNNYLFHTVSDRDTMMLQIFPTFTWQGAVFALAIMFFLVCIGVLSGLLLIVYDKIKEKIQSYRSRNLIEQLRAEQRDLLFRGGRANGDEHAHGREVFHPISSEEFAREYEEGQFGRLQKSLNIRFPTVQYSEDDRYDLCVVCYTSFVEGEKIRVLKKCGHAYHQSCIDKWLLEYSTTLRQCPMCNRKVFMESSCSESGGLTEYESSANEYTPLLGSSCPK